MAYDLEIAVDDAEVVHVMKAACDSRNLVSKDPERSRVKNWQMRSTRMEAYQFRLVRIGPITEVFR